MNLYSLSEIEIELRATADAACAYGMSTLIESKGITIEELLTNKEKYSQDFIKNCHDGFKLAQNKIIKNVLAIQEEQDLISAKLKIARVQKNKIEIADYIKKSKHLESILVLFKHCADALAWQLIRGQLWISRNLYLKVEGHKKLKDVNLKSVIMVADKINSNPMNFVLITDLTNNIQVGDLIGLIDGEFVIEEVKKGDKNLKVLEVIQELSTNQTTPKDVIDKFAKEPYFINHLQRTIKQHRVLQDVHEILSTDKGTDPTTKKEIKIITPKETTPTYTERLSALQEQLKERNFWAYDLIENCLHIGIYKGEKRFDGHLLLKAISEHSNRPNCIIVDALSILESLNKPIFFLPFSPDFIFDLIFRRTKMYFMLDLDGYIELFDNYPLNAVWANKKETGRAIKIAKNHGIFMLNDRGIKINLKVDGSEEMWLSHGALTRIFFEHIYPSYSAYSFQYYLEQNGKQT